MFSTMRDALPCNYAGMLGIHAGLFLASLLCLASPALSNLIFDSTSALTVTELRCFYGQNDNFTVARVYNPIGEVDQVGFKNLELWFDLQYEDADAIQADIIFSPCLANCKNKISDIAEQFYQVATLMFGDYYDNGGQPLMDSGYFVWVEVDPTQPWSSDKTTNQKTLMKIVNAVYQRNAGLGIIANYNTWTKLFGASFTEPSKYAKYLWWDYHNGQQDLTTGWTPFGGWNKPYAHRYAADVTSNSCAKGTKINLSYYEGSAASKAVQKKDQKKMVRKMNPKFKKVVS